MTKIDNETPTLDTLSEDELNQVVGGSRAYAPKAAKKQIVQIKPSYAKHGNAGHRSSYGKHYGY